MSTNSGAVQTGRHVFQPALPGAPVELTLAGAVRQGRFLQFYYKQEARFWQASGCGGGGASPLSLAALAGVSPALPRGEPSVRPWAAAE